MDMYMQRNRTDDVSRHLTVSRYDTNASPITSRASAFMLSTPRWSAARATALFAISLQ